MIFNTLTTLILTVLIFIWKVTGLSSSSLSSSPLCSPLLTLVCLAELLLLSLSTNQRCTHGQAVAWAPAMLAFLLVMSNSPCFKRALAPPHNPFSTTSTTASGLPPAQNLLISTTFPLTCTLSSNARNYLFPFSISPSPSERTDFQLTSTKTPLNPSYLDNTSSHPASCMDTIDHSHSLCHICIQDAVFHSRASKMSAFSKCSLHATVVNESSIPVTSVLQLLPLD